MRRARAGWGECDDNVLVEGRGIGTRRVNPTADSRGVRTAIQNHAAWLVNGIISDTGEHRIRCCPGSLFRAISLVHLFFFFFSILFLSFSLLPLLTPSEKRCRVRRCSLRKPSSHFSLSLFLLLFVTGVVMNNQRLEVEKLTTENDQQRR